MILTQLKPLRSPLLDGKTMQKSMLMTRRRLISSVRAQIRRAKSQVRTYVRSQYYISTAVRDAKVAVRQNEDIFIATTMALFVIGYAAVSTLADFLLLFLQTALSLSELSGFNITILAIMAFGVCSVLLSWIAAGLFSAQTIAIADGANRKINRSLRSTSNRSLQLTTRVTTTWVIMAALLFGPALVSAAAAMIYLKVVGTDLAYTLEVLSYVSVAAVAWLMIASINIALAPIVAILEPNASYAQVFARSHQLVKRRGRIFLIGVGIATATAVATSYGLASVLEYLFGINKWLPFSALCLAVLAVQNSILTALYRKRKLARKN